MKILLTGGAGYIGSHTAVELIEAGHELVVIDNLSNSSVKSLRRVEAITQRDIVFHRVNLADLSGVREVFSSESIDAVIHFAGLKSVNTSLRDPIRYYQNNVGSTLILLQVMAEFGVHKLVFSSSATVYGIPQELPVSETAGVGFGITSPYGRSKSMIEQILTDASLAEPKLQIAILRYFNPIGAHVSGRIGEDPRNTPSNLLPYVSQVAIGLRKKVAVYGQQYPTTDGTGVRDYIHVVDLAHGHLRALDHLRSGVSTYNLGTGRGYSVLEVIEAFSRVSGRDIPLEIVAARSGDVAMSFADVEKAKRELAWVAERTLDDACRDVWRWQLQNPRGYDD
ncbi:UDP-glucose 4-epimerase GalE [Cryobacterium sp. PH31-L1]|uniref:UDP-glucose 4-epimerase GalE n=1 Tax=Cryobacterium sp. PH31-L1 TaxID=3046199 RepID=UPI0024B9B19A|nr:UDP-glucose 4-epimerase GalE [Cryobacterium sp. PH31-L1]MDJ0376967.1 UDP-glucose 4-epimerase GalE [Cryobacterium sp. PH31-L1]